MADFGSMTEAIRRSFNNLEASDIRIQFSGRTIYAHRFVLSMISTSYFPRIFKEFTADILTLREDDPDALEAALKFSYGIDSVKPLIQALGQSGSSFDRILQLNSVADKYDIERLSDCIQNSIRAHVGGMEVLPASVPGIFGTVKFTYESLPKPHGFRMLMGVVMEHILQEECGHDDKEYYLKELPELANEIALRHILPPRDSHSSSHPDTKWSRWKHLVDLDDELFSYAKITPIN